MKYRFVFTFFVILSFHFYSYGSKTIIKGNASQFSGNELTVTSYKDYISNEKFKIGYTTIKSNGSYNFEFDIKNVKKVILKIEDKTTWFFIEPGKVYNINLSYDKELNKGRVYDKQLSLQFNFPIPNELNQLVKKFNNSYDKFIDDNVLLFKKRDRSIEPKLKAFKTKTLKEYERYSNSFINNYILYTFASTQNSLDVSYFKKDVKKATNTKANLYLEYLHEKPIVYHNPEYISFFKSFFKGELKTLSLELKGMDISAAINDKNSLEALSKALAKYPFLQDKEFKSLFLLHSLLEISKDTYFKKENIVSILNQVVKSSPYPYHKEIASNIKNRITKKRFGEGSVAPDFELEDKNGEAHTLSSFKGKPVYINFWTNWSIPAKKEMKVMQTLYKKNKNKVHFISICADNDINKMKKFLEKNEGHNWLFLHAGKDKKILEKYSIATFPTYVLLDKSLTVYKFPAGRPGGTAERATEDNIEKDFYDLIKNK